MAEQTSTGYFQNPYKFNGKELDAETGLYYYGARYYDPRGSLWLSVDPMMEKYAGWSPYNYTLDNPIKFTDPTGCGPEDEANDPYLLGRVIKTAFFEIKHSVENFIFNIGGARVPGIKWNADYKTDQNGNQYFETEIKLVPKETTAKEVLNTLVDGVNVITLSPKGVLLTKGGKTQISQAAKEIITQWGWTGTKSWTNLVNKVKSGGTIDNLSGKIPTKAEALRMIEEAGGKRIRIEGPHTSPNPHNYNHINYTSPSGVKGTIKIQEL